MKVLMVLAEDRGVREALRAALPETDMLVFESNLDGASRRLVSLQADALVLDDGPGLGAPALPALRALAPGVPVLALSNRGDLLSQANLARGGAKDVLAKPFSCEDLRDAIARMLAPLPMPAPASIAALPETERSPSLHQHQMALRWLGRAARYGDDPARLGTGLAETLTDIFDAVRTAVLLEQDRGVRLVASVGLSGSLGAELQLSFASGLMRYFDEQASLIDRTQAGAMPDVFKEMQVIGAQIAAPLVRDGRVFGAIALGEKASGHIYSRAERDLISLIARSTSMAFERAQRAHQTEERRERLDRVFAAMDSGVVCISRDRMVSLVNGAAERLLDLRAHDLLGRSVQKLGSPIADVALRAMTENKPIANAIVREAATASNLVVNATPMNGDGVVIVFDVQKAEPVGKDDLAHSPFWEYLAGRVAQEIKNPMVAINTFAQLLPRKYDSEDFRDAYSRVVQQEIARINAVAETLFDFSREPKPDLRRIKINDAVHEAIHAFDKELNARSIKLAEELDPRVDEAEADPAYFAQAMRNVMQNAIDAMPNGGTLRIETRRDGGIAAIRIADTGPGVSDEQAAQVFLPFFSTKEQGMGLGLPIARRIARQHHGDLKLASRDNKGAGFEFTLPALETSNANDTGR